MITQKDSLSDDTDHHSRFTQQHPGEQFARKFIEVFDTRSAFFDDAFIRKLREGNRKALAELQRHTLPPTPMDLRKELADCVKANLPDSHLFAMKNGRVYLLEELKRVVPEWSNIAEKALIDSDAVLADKLMSPAQWNAKSAFEVTFMNALNELRDLKKMKQAPASLEHYTKWTIDPLKKSIAQVRSAGTPLNALIGYGDRIPLAQALRTAETLDVDFQKLVKSKGG